MYYSSAYVPPYQLLRRPALGRPGLRPLWPRRHVPFLRHPYGHPYDPWIWPYMSGGYSRYLALLLPARPLTALGLVL